MKNKEIKRKSIRVLFTPILLISLLTALDQLTKHIITSSFKLHDSKSLIDGVFSLTYIQNRGMAWGMFQGKIPVFLIFTCIVLLFCFKVLINVNEKKRYIPVKYTVILLVSGALGNLIDRVKLGYVVDFLNFELIDFPIFNVADIFVVVSMIAAMILLVFVYTNEEFDEILSLKLTYILEGNICDSDIADVDTDDKQNAEILEDE